MSKASKTRRRNKLKRRMQGKQQHPIPGKRPWLAYLPGRVTGPSRTAGQHSPLLVLVCTSHLKAQEYKTNIFKRYDDKKNSGPNCEELLKQTGMLNNFLLKQK